MKKLMSIWIALLILLSGMHFSVATHYCGGKVAATKVSFSGKEASCGMISDKSDKSGETRISRNCCDDKVAVYQINDDYSPSSFPVKDFVRGTFHATCLPGGFSHYSAVPVSTNPSNTGPPGRYLASSVSMAAICVFRI